MNRPIRLGVSRCLLGDKVRYDGGHKRDPFLIETLGQYVEYVPVCPEVECGLPIPREAMRLVGNPDSPRLVTQKTGIDHTARMQGWARGRLEELETEGLCGFIFKSKSPSSGMERIKVYSESGNLSGQSVGIFARMFMQRFPLLPVEEEGRLHDPQLRENFIDRIFVLRRYRDMLRSGQTLGNLVTFHTRHKLQLMAHSPELYRAMGQLVAKGKELPKEQLFRSYHEHLMQATRMKATPPKHRNVLQHIMGYFKNDLHPDEKQELMDLISQYARGIIPLIVPVTLLNHYVNKYDEFYLQDQTYLHPHPVELKLRNHA
ncbi:MAG: DUF523 and DUF1722 domain-containing protein [Desulfovibrionales bacterium]|nr:DUF523 and DUF1722 domain-containing protein [Desulfovibrionales bacterium]